MARVAHKGELKRRHASHCQPLRTCVDNRKQEPCPQHQKDAVAGQVYIGLRSDGHALDFETVDVEIDHLANHIIRLTIVARF